MSSSRDLFGIPKYAPLDRINSWTDAYQNQFSFGAGFGTVTNVSIFVKRDGDSLKIRGQFTVGTTSAVPTVITLPPGFNVNLKALGLDPLGVKIITVRVGSMYNVSGGAAGLTGSSANAFVSYIESDNLKLQFSQSTQSNSYGATNTDSIIGSGSNCEFEVEVPLHTFAN